MLTTPTSRPSPQRLQQEAENKRIEQKLHYLREQEIVHTTNSSDRNYTDGTQPIVRLR